MAHGAQGRRLFDQLTVEENLVMGGYTRSLADAKRQIDMVYSLFPRLVPKRSTVSGYLSGGEQQMVADRPRADVVPEAADARRAHARPGAADHRRDLRDRHPPVPSRRHGHSPAEQNAQMALAIADYGYIMENGRVVLDGEADKMLRNDDVREFYLGFGEGGSRKNMRDVKHYKRRKRWLS